MERLDKLLAATGQWSRKEAKALVKAGRVQVGGARPKGPEDKVAEGTPVTVDGRPIATEQGVYVMLHKPAGVVSSTQDPRERTVLDLLPQHLRRRTLFPVGRLDKDTHGLVLLTDDGDYAHRMLSPKKAIFKRYQAVLDGPADDRHVALFHEGTSLEDGTRCLPAKLTILRAGDRPLVEVEICEGKYHQIKRMFEAVGRKVLWLKRYAIGGLVLDPSLPEEKCRELTPEETASVFF